MISMTKKRTDRSKFQNFWSESDSCQSEASSESQKMSSIPLKYYNQLHCMKAKMFRRFEQTFNCSIDVMFGTNDLYNHLPMCNRSDTEKMMGTMSNMTDINCPLSCIEEKIDTSISFTLFSDENFENACRIWKMCDGIEKDSIAMLYFHFTSLQVQVDELVLLFSTFHYYFSTFHLL